MEKTKLAKVADVIGAPAPEQGERVVEQVAVSLDKVSPGCLFFELRSGEAQRALALGAAAAVCPCRGQGMLFSEDPMEALERLAAWHRRLFHTWLLAVTGSIGKTTVKEMTHDVLETEGRTAKTPWNLDRKAGLSLALLELDWEDKNAVLEVGFSFPGNIGRMSRIMRPSAALITCVGTGHLSQCGDRQTLLREKLAITEGMAPSAPLIINGDDDMLQQAYEFVSQELISYGVGNPAADVQGKVLRESLEGTELEVSYYGKRQLLQVPLWGKAGVYNALAAFTAGVVAGVDSETAARRIAGFRPAPHRQNILHLGDITVLDDSCSASPESMREALRLLGQLPGKRRIAVLGEMPDLGGTAENAHRAIGRRAAQCGVDLLCCLGPHAAFTAEGADRMRGVRALTFADSASLITYLQNDKKPGDTVLVKGDRCQRMEEIIRQVWDKDSLRKEERV